MRSPGDSADVRACSWRMKSATWLRSGGGAPRAALCSLTVSSRLIIGRARRRDTATPAAPTSSAVSMATTHSCCRSSRAEASATSRGCIATTCQSACCAGPGRLTTLRATITGCPARRLTLRAVSSGRPRQMSGGTMSRGPITTAPFSSTSASVRSRRFSLAPSTRSLSSTKLVTPRWAAITARTSPPGPRSGMPRSATSSGTGRPMASSCGRSATGACGAPNHRPWLPCLNTGRSAIERPSSRPSKPYSTRPSGRT